MKYLLTNIARGLIFFTSAADPCKKNNLAAPLYSTLTPTQRLELFKCAKYSVG